MATNARVIVLEFNELAPAVMHRFISAGELPNFKRFYGESRVYLTEAAERAPYLEPWIQWVTLHSGLNFAEHGIEKLNEGHKLQQPRVWDLVSAAGRPVWICGSMSVAYKAPINGGVLPDPWTTDVQPFPSSVMPYFSFVQRNVLEYTSKKVPLTRSDYLRFLGFMASHGLSAQTVTSTIKQLLEERSGHGRWKRAAILDKLQFDVFRHFYRKLRPHFSTFFLNSTAHYQHFYWRNMEPESFKVKPTDAEQAEYESAILFGYKEMDKLLGRFMELAGDDATLVFCTAISQQPYLLYEEQGGRTAYRPTDFAKLLAFAGVTAPNRISPVMAQQFHAYFESEAEAINAERLLAALRVGDRQVLDLRRNAEDVFAGCHLYGKMPPETTIANAEGRSMRFNELFYQIEGMKSGMHHPDGLLWIRTPERQHVVFEGKMPLVDVAPTFLQMLSLPIPAFMKGTPLPARREDVRRHEPLSQVV